MKKYQIKVLISFDKDKAGEKNANCIQKQLN
ncbi:hypothetical protein [Candidatus Phytoplasma oryzae]|nr:hypothetical protein PIE28_02065 [Candidatus Phytoplasma oryzae]